MGLALRRSVCTTMVVGRLLKSEKGDTTKLTSEESVKMKEFLSAYTSVSVLIHAVGFFKTLEDQSVGSWLAEAGF